MTAATLEACPKHMRYGPCGGVSADGRCEVGTEPCVFLGLPLASYPDPDDTSFATSAIAERPVPEQELATAAGRELYALMDARPVVITGIPAAPLDSGSLLACAEELVGRADAVISGDSGRARVQFPPSYRAALLLEAGLRPLMGINCRDRNRVALEGELVALADSGAAAVLCVTGDHTDSGDRPDAAPVFDLEGTQLVPLARRLGLLTAVPESPSAPPVAQRAERLAAKAALGAQLSLLQYAGDVGRIADFVAEVLELAPGLRIVPGVPLVIDPDGARLLASFAAAELPAGFVDGVLEARDPAAAGIAAAVSFGAALMAVPGVAGVAVTGGARFGQEVEFSRALAEVAAELGGGGGVSAPR